MTTESPSTRIERLAGQLAALHIELAYAVDDYMVEQRTPDSSPAGYRKASVADIIHGATRHHLLRAEEETLNLIDFINGKTSAEDLDAYLNRPSHAVT